MSGEGLISSFRGPRPIALQRRRARLCFAVLAKSYAGGHVVRLLVTGDGSDCACTPVELDLDPARAELLAQELLQFAWLARHPGEVRA